MFKRLNLSYEITNEFWAIFQKKLEIDLLMQTMLQNLQLVDTYTSKEWHASTTIQTVVKALLYSQLTKYIIMVKRLSQIWKHSRIPLYRHKIKSWVFILIICEKHTLQRHKDMHKDTKPKLLNHFEKCSPQPYISTWFYPQYLEMSQMKNVWIIVFKQLIIH